MGGRSRGVDEWNGGRLKRCTGEGVQRWRGGGLKRWRGGGVQGWRGGGLMRWRGAGMEGLRVDEVRSEKWDNVGGGRGDRSVNRWMRGMKRFRG